MYIKEQILSGNRKFVYANKGDEVTVKDKTKHPLLLVENKKSGEKFIVHADLLSIEPLELSEIKSPENEAIRMLKNELRKQLRSDSYIYRIIYNRVYYGKVTKFQKHIDKDLWLKTAGEIWDVSDYGNDRLLDVLKANV